MQFTHVAHDRLAFLVLDQQFLCFFFITLRQIRWKTKDYHLTKTTNKSNWPTRDDANK